MAQPGDLPQPAERTVGAPLAYTWEYVYTALLPVLDALLITVAAYVALRQRFGDATTPVAGTTYQTLVALAAPAWVVVIALSRAYEPKFLGVGSEEFKRVFNACIRFAAVVAATSYALRAELARGFVAIALPLGTVLLLLGRYGARRVLHWFRGRGRCLHRAVVVGTRAEVKALAEQMASEPYAGLVVVGACVTGAGRRIATESGEIPVLGTPAEVAGVLGEVTADTVAIAGSRSVDSAVIRRIAWELEGSGVDLLVVPTLTDVAGPRIHIRPVAGLPLLHVEEPQFGGVRRTVKSVMDRTLALLLLAFASPLFIGVAVAIQFDDRGPVFYRQERVGRDGRTFRIWKFRSMRVGSDREIATLAEQNEKDGVLFKIRQDPRITRVGRWLRKYSLDELPQLFNVLVGQMSLVGPRPPLPSEVERYESDTRRRLLVKPGMTGLWQISGRSDLAWSQSVRLDLYYVENWSPALDLMILWKTAFAVLAGRGAY